MSAYKTLIAECESDIRSGQPQNVARRLTKLNTARVPREWRLPLANLCRRAGLNSLGMTLLARVVHPQRLHSTDAATSQELAEYSVLLLRSGALSEAQTTLNQVDSQKVPESLLYRAFCNFSAWEFRDAIPHLEKYIQAPIAPYASLVGKVNLAYALVECGLHEQALALLEENIQLCKQNSHSRLESNCFSLRAQVYIQTQNFAPALEDLQAAHQLLGGAQTIDSLFITKWKLVVEALQNKTTAPLDKLRALAIKNQDWESVREADLFSLKVDFQRGRFLHLVFGTPFEQYRERIIREVGCGNDRSVYVYGEKTVPRFDLRTGEIDGAPANNPGRKCHQLVDVLLRDFYRPLRVGGIFSGLFRGEHYDISSSPDRVYQVIRRTRQWFVNDRVPLEIREQNGFYSLHITGKFSFRVPLERDSVECMNLHFNNLRAAYGAGQMFSAKDAREILSLSRRTIQRLVNWGIENHKIESLDANRNATKYRILAANQTLRAA